MTIYVVSPSVSPEELIGDMPLAPREMTGRSEADLARAMAEHLLTANPASGAKALAVLRDAFPDSPLTVRVAALAALAGRTP
jgi:hypothetical protein